MTIHSQDCSIEDWEAPSDASTPHHGTAVAGLIGAEGENGGGGAAANAVGVVWHPRLHLAKYNSTAITVGNSQVIDDLEDVVGWRASSFSNYLYVEAFALAGVNLINMSFGKVLFKKDKNEDGEYELTDTYLDEPDPRGELETRIDRAERLWLIVLGHYDDVLVINSSGNDGKKCDDGADPLFCTAAAKQTPCAVSDIVVAARVLCTSGFDPDDFSIYESSGRDGDSFAAPGRHIDILSLEGGLLMNKAGTSYAAPLATGAAAFLKGIDETLSPSKIHHALRASDRHAIRGEGEVYRLLDLGHATRQVMCQPGVDADIDEDICPSYYDVPASHWGHGPITKLSCDCVLQGHPYGNGRFGPNDEITRAEALKIILELGFPDEAFWSTPTDFDDVPPAAWHSGYVQFADAKGMLDFMAPGSVFSPNAPITRGDTARLLVEASKHSCMNEYEKLHWMYQQYAEGLAEVGEEYSDHDQFGSQQEDAIYAATSRCVASGYDDGTDSFGVNNTLLRAEVAKIGCLARHGLSSDKCGLTIDCSPYPVPMFGWKNDGCPFLGD